jgi:hypothetical protein
VRVGAKAAAGSYNHKVYIARYSLNGTKGSAPIGACSAISLETARREARKIMGEVAGGKDPALDRKARRQTQDAFTLGQLIERWTNNPVDICANCFSRIDVTGVLAHL